MHPSLIILTFSAAALASAQVTFNTSTYQFNCPSTPLNGAYCTGPSLTSSIIIRCNGTIGIAGNCNDNLVGVQPIGVKGFAPCYESTPTAGDAACSYGGTVYPDTNASSFPVPGPGNTNANTTPTATVAAGSNNISLSTPQTSLQTPTSTPHLFAPASSSPMPALVDLAPPLPSARYPIPSASNGTTASASAANGSGTGTGTGTGTGRTAPSKTGTPFTGAAAGRTEKAHVFATLFADAAAFVGWMLFL